MSIVVWEGQELRSVGHPDGAGLKGALTEDSSCKPTLLAALDGFGEPFGTLIAFYDEVDSTNDIAFQSAQGEGSVFVAGSQRKGKGREGRTWESPPLVGLYFSAVALPEIAEHWGGLFMQAAAVSIARAIRDLISLDASVKWPNDVLVAGKKACGVMAQVNTTLGRRVCVIGVGVNVNNSSADLPAGISATSLALELGENVQRGPLLASILGSMNRMYGMLSRREKSRVLGLCNSFSASVGAHVTARSDCERNITGKAIMIGESGELVVETDDGRRHAVKDPLAVVEQKIKV